MEITNKEIKIGNKSHKFKNLILNNYLQMYSNCFLEDSYKSLEIAYIMFDKKLHVTEDTTQMEYDVMLPSFWMSAEDEAKQIVSNNSVEIRYVFKNYASENELFTKVDWNQYVGKKITGIGFGAGDILGKIHAFLDTSNYNLVIQENQNIVITRVDRLQTNANFFGVNINFPLHLSPNYFINTQNNNRRYKVVLKNVGFGVTAQEFDVLYNENEFTVAKGETSVVITAPYTTVAPRLGLYPSNLLYPSGDLFPEQIEGLYPKNDLHPSGSLYPESIPFRYILYRFVVQELKDIEAGYKDTNMSYTQSYPLTKYGNLKYLLKYERGE
ncbi:MAG: hypothetical protein RR662_05555 [Clostridia bacterium]